MDVLRLIYFYGYFPLTDTACIYGAFFRNAIGNRILTLELVD